MEADNQEWLPLDRAAARFGYSHPESLRQRIRQLRTRGHVVDIGRPPGYPIGDDTTKQKVIVLWPHPTTALLRSDAPTELLNPKRGKRPRSRKREER